MIHELQICSNLGLFFLFSLKWFWRSKSFKFWWSLSYLFFFPASAFCVLTNLCSHHHHKTYSPLFMSRSLRCWLFYLGMLYIWILFLIWCDIRVRVHYFHSDIELLWHYLLKGLSFCPIELPLHLCWKSVDCKCSNIFLDSPLFHWPVCLSLWKYHTVSTIILESDCINHLILFSFY